MKKRLLILLSVLALLLLGGIGFIASPLFAVTPIEQTITIEAGKKYTPAPSDFLEGAAWCVKLSYVDSSALKTKAVGDYPVYIYHGFKRYTQTVSVVDTTAPTITCNVQNIKVKKDKGLTVSSLGTDAKDVTEIDRLLFQHVVAETIFVPEGTENKENIENAYKKGRDLWTETYSFEYGGKYTLTICALDKYDNRSYLTLNVTVEEAPTLTVVSDVYLATGLTIDFLPHVTVWDFIDTDLSPEDVTIDVSGINHGKAGDYKVVYTVKDSYGLKAQAETTVHVLAPAELQRLINTHQINKDDHVISGAYNLYDAGYLTEPDTDQIFDLTKAAIVHIENDDNNTHGSGFILKIDKDFVTIATNSHVIVGDLHPEIVFYDGTICTGLVVAHDDREDIAFVRIPISTKDIDIAIHPDIAENLRTIHINEAYWKGLENDCGITICYNCIGCEAEVWQETVGNLVYKEAVRTWNEYEDINECIISPDPIPGTSGSAVLDANGRLISMVRGWTDYGDYIETVTVPLCEILDYYQYVFHQKLQYQ